MQVLIKFGSFVVTYELSLAEVTFSAWSVLLQPLYLTRVFCIIVAVLCRLLNVKLLCLHFSVIVGCPKNVYIR